MASVRSFGGWRRQLPTRRQSRWTPSSGGSSTRRCSTPRHSRIWRGSGRQRSSEPSRTARCCKSGVPCDVPHPQTHLRIPAVRGGRDVKQVSAVKVGNRRATGHPETGATPGRSRRPASAVSPGVRHDNLSATFERPVPCSSLLRACSLGVPHLPKERLRTLWQARLDFAGRPSDHAIDGRGHPRKAARTDAVFGRF